MRDGSLLKLPQTAQRKLREGLQAQTFKVVQRRVLSQCSSQNEANFFLQIKVSIGQKQI